MDAFSHMTADQGDAGDAYEEQWIEVAVMGCPHEQQMEIRSGAMRHRLWRTIPPIFRDGAWRQAVVQQHPDEGWTEGPAPINLGGFGG